MTLTNEDATKIGLAIASIPTTLLGWLTWKTANRKQVAESTEARMAREEAIERAKQERLDGGVWRIITQLEAEVNRQGARVLAFEGKVVAMEETIASLRGENITVRGELAAAQYTITRLSTENAALQSDAATLRARVAELERHDGPGTRGA